MSEERAGMYVLREVVDWMPEHPDVSELLRYNREAKRRECKHTRTKRRWIDVARYQTACLDCGA